MVIVLRRNNALSRDNTVLIEHLNAIAKALDKDEPD